MIKANLQIMDMGHQGDVILQRIAKPPKGERIDIKEKGIAVLAHGEVTGHSHKIVSGDVLYYKVQRSVNMFETFLEVLSDTAILEHEEHYPIELPKGIYSVRIQREYFPAEIKKVID